MGDTHGMHLTSTLMLNLFGVFGTRLIVDGPPFHLGHEPPKQGNGPISDQIALAWTAR